jgi:hypothetical protein
MKMTRSKNTRARKNNENQSANPKSILVAAIEKAVLEYYIATDRKTGSMEKMNIGQLVLAYLYGAATFVEIIDDGYFEPPTCGSDYLIAERAISLIERSCGNLAEGLDHHAIDSVLNLCERAGVYGARRALRRHESPVMGGNCDDDVPF